MIRLLLSILIAIPALAQQPLTPAADVAILKGLPKLAKPVYVWPEVDLLLRVRDPGYCELVRVSGTVNIRLENLDEAYIDSASRLMRTYNAKLAIHYSPYYKIFAPGAKPGSQDPRRDGAAELKWLAEQLRLLRLYCRWYGVSFVEVFLDTECFTYRIDDAEWNLALDRKYNDVYALWKSAFPQCRIHWFGRGWQRVSLFIDGGIQAETFGDMHQSGDSVSCALYRLDQPYEGRASMAATLAGSKGQPVVLWLCPGGCYRQDWEVYVLDATSHHDVSWDWLAGYMMAYKPWSQADVIAIWPGMWEQSPKGAWTQNTRHFAAWVRGVSRVRKLDDLRGDK